MSDNYLSQAEIDALLNQGSTSGTDTSKAAKAIANKVQEVLDQLGASSVSVGLPEAQEVGNTRLIPALSGMVVSPLSFSPRGKCMLALDEEIAAKIAATVMGQDATEALNIDEMGLSVIGEAFSQIAGGISTLAAKESGSTVTVDPSVPEVYDGDEGFFTNLFGTAELGAFKARVEVGEFEPADLWIITDENFEAMWGAGASEAAASSTAAIAPRPAGTIPTRNERKSISPPPAEINVKRAMFSPLETADSKQFQNINLLLDVPLEVVVELGRTSMQIKEILDLGKGSLIELSKLAGEPVDIVVNGKLLAKGEVVVIDETFGVKIVDIVSPVERVNSLQ